MQISLDGKVMDFNELKFDIRLMAHERIMGEFLRNDEFKLGWFRHYQPVDLRRLEEIIRQAKKQYCSLPEDEKGWLGELQDFYEDFKSFDWEEYDSLKDDAPRRLRYEIEIGIRWAKKLKGLIIGYTSPYTPNPELEFLNDPLQYLLFQAETEYVKRPLGIWRPKEFIEE